MQMRLPLTTNGQTDRQTNRLTGCRHLHGRRQRCSWKCRWDFYWHLTDKLIDRMQTITWKTSTLQLKMQTRLPLTNGATDRPTDWLSDRMQTFTWKTSTLQLKVQTRLPLTTLQRRIVRSRDPDTTNSPSFEMAQHQTWAKTKWWLSWTSLSYIREIRSHSWKRLV